MKSRFWSFILYPESCKNDWKDYLIEHGCVFAVSPLHDNDYTPEGEKKKDHWHILLQFDGPTTYNNVKDNICDKVGGTIPKKVISMRGYYRYLTHLDNPEKAQYDPAGIECYGGFNCELTTSEVTYIMSCICDDIEKENIIEYADLVYYYRILGDYDRFEIVANHTLFFNTVLKSRRYSGEISDKSGKSSNDLVNIIDDYSKE